MKSTEVLNPQCENGLFKNEAVAVINLLISLFCSLVAHRGRKHDNRQTDIQDKYCNPHCTCVPRVNNDNSTFNYKSTS